MSCLTRGFSYRTILTNDDLLHKTDTQHAADQTCVWKEQAAFLFWQADGGNWQVYCNRAWVFAPVSVEQIVDHCAAAPCQHAGRCVEQADSYVCLCAPVRTNRTRPFCDRMFW